MNKKVKVIELNPFHIGGIFYIIYVAGACLFSWKTDRELFLNGPLGKKINLKII